VTSEPLEQRQRRLRNQAALADVRLHSHRTRCATCARHSGFYEGLCVLGIALRRELDAARRILQALEPPI